MLRAFLSIFFTDVTRCILTVGADIIRPPCFVRFNDTSSPLRGEAYIYATKSLPLDGEGGSAKPRRMRWYAEKRQAFRGSMNCTFGA